MSLPQPVQNALVLSLGTHDAVRELVAALDAAPQAAAGHTTAQDVTIKDDLQFKVRNDNKIIFPVNVAAPLKIKDSAARIYITFVSTNGSKSVNIGTADAGISFFGHGIRSRPDAITQTYSTASRTHDALLSQGVFSSVTTQANDLALCGATNAANQATTINNNFELMYYRIDALRAQLLLAKYTLNCLIMELAKYGLVSWS